jgi:hypothetical protein
MSVVAWARKAKRAADRAAESRWIEWLGRIGLVAKGVSFCLVGVIAILVALGVGTKPEDRQGALRLIAEQSWGALILILLGSGFAAYATWRFAQAVLNFDDEDDDAGGWAKRGANLAKGLLYAGLAALAFSFVTGPRGESASEQQHVDRVLGWPVGQELVGAIGVALIVGGLWNGYRSITGHFAKDVRTEKMDRPVEWWFDVVGVVGHAARMFVFCMVGIFLVRAAYQYDPTEAVGFDGALRRLAQQTYGDWWLAAVAAGLLAYGLFSLLQARYRDL